MGMDDVPRCQHLKMNGTQCGCPALRWRRLCFFHDRIKRERKKIANDTTAERPFDLPLLEDANSVQVALMKTIQMLGSGRLDHKTAGLMLYALQTASSNLRRADFEADNATNVVIDRDDIHRTSIDGPQWFEEDFGEEAEVEEEVELDDEKEVEDEHNLAAAPAEAAAVAKPVVAKKPPEVKHVTLEEARMQVRGVVQNWLLDKANEEAAAKPG